MEVVLNEEDHRATVTVMEDQQSLAIGRGGQNVRLAAKLTGWNIDIMSVGGATVDSEKAEPATAPMTTQSEEEFADAADEGAVEMAQAMSTDNGTEESSEGDVSTDVSGLTMQESVITEDDAQNNTLTAEEESTFTDNGSIADGRESRDETSETLADNA
jgi:N utilization substance protein A